MPTMEVVFLGINDIGMQIYEWLCDRGSVDVFALLTEPDQLELVHDEEPDVLLSVGFDHLVPLETLSVPSEGAINLHPSYLPYNRGKSPNVWPLIEDTPAGVTLHYMDEKFDTGDIIAQRKVQTDFSDTGKDLHERLKEAQYDLFTDIWPSIERGTVDTKPQREGAGEYHSTKDFLELCELQADEEVEIKAFLDRLRALTFPPFDNAKLEISGTTYYVDIEIRKQSSDESPDRSLLSPY